MAKMRFREHNEPALKKGTIIVEDRILLEIQKTNIETKKVDKFKKYLYISLVLNVLLLLTTIIW